MRRRDGFHDERRAFVDGSSAVPPDMVGHDRGDLFFTAVRATE